MRKKIHILRYVIADYNSAAISWGLFYIFRKEFIEPVKYGVDIPLEFGTRFLLGIFLVPVFWVLLYYFTGFYKYKPRRTRVNEFGQTFFTTLFGVLALFFALILDDMIITYKTYYTSTLALFSIHLVLTFIPRFILSTYTYRRIQKGKVVFNTLMIGGNKSAYQLYKDIISQENERSGNRFAGFIHIHEKPSYPLAEEIPHLGNLEDLSRIIKKHEIEELIIAIEGTERKEISKIINKIYVHNVTIKANPNLYDILTGKVKMSTLFGTPLIQLSHELMPVWEENLKYFIDKLVSLVMLTLLSPFCLVLAIIIKLTSKGPVIYSHERIGRYGKPFTIYKFRSMYLDAEKHGPKLSHKHDKRMTPVGKIMRRSKLDEIPNFFNVLKGDMSLVGPRPERQYFIDQITKKAPHYVLLHKVKPGITSWGQVKYGYAENVDQMVKRLRFDLIYIENISLIIDFKIIYYTFLTILKGKGI